MRASRAEQETEASAEHTTPFCVGMETTPQDSSPLHRRKCATLVQKPSVLKHNMYPLSNQLCGAPGTVISRRIQCTILRTATPDIEQVSQTRPERNNAPNSQVRTTRACNPEIIPKACVDCHDDGPGLSHDPCPGTCRCPTTGSPLHSLALCLSAEISSTQTMNKI